MPRRLVASPAYSGVLCRKSASAHRELSMSAIPSSSPSSSPPAWMSWWDKYFAPGDLRRRQQQTPPTPPSGTPSADNNGTPHSIAQPNPVSTPHVPLTPAHRARRQNALFFGGLTFSLLSFAVTRRTILRKRLSTYPATFTPSHMHIEPPPGPQQQMSKAEGSLMAAEALGLATLNCFSVFMAGIGGAMMWFDVAEPEDLRRTVAEGSLEYIGGGKVDEEAEKEVEGWIASAFGGQAVQRKEEGEGSGILNGLGGDRLKHGVLQELEKARQEKEKQAEVR